MTKQPVEVASALSTSHEDGVEPNFDLPDDPEDKAVAHIHIFRTAHEHAVIRIIEEDEPDNGYSLEMDPMGGMSDSITRS